uniref:Uncharacterized protein n=1 Tax=Prolemur simus TaxID=1328070 RepID=A0A8C8Z345_PROSS
MVVHCWRQAKPRGIRYSQICAKVTRDALKTEFKADAEKAPGSSIETVTEACNCEAEAGGCLSPGVGGCSELGSHCCTPAWTTEQKTQSLKKKKKEEERKERKGIVKVKKRIHPGSSLKCYIFKAKMCKDML